MKEAMDALDQVIRQWVLARQAENGKIDG